MARHRTRATRQSAAAATFHDGNAGPEASRGGVARGAGLAPATNARDSEPARYTLGIESDSIVVRHAGELTVSVIEASRRAVAEVAAARRLARILLDLSGATSGLAPVEIFELCASQSFVLPPAATVAVVYRPDQFPAEDASFAETVSLNHGATLRVFTDVEAALQWLSGK